MDILVINSPLFLARTRVMRQNAQQRAKAVHRALEYTLDEFRALVRSWLGRAGTVTCTYCIQLLTEATVSCDHIVPLARRIGVRTFTLGNLAPSCDSCNRCKGTLTGDEFSDLLRLLSTWVPQARASVFGRLKAGALRCAGKGY